jgi:hypothetical protein
VAQDENSTVIDLYLEISMHGMEPAIEQSDDFEPALAEPESERFLLTSVTSMTFDADGHDLIAPRRLLFPPGNLFEPLN